jgi:hypothetical protein
MAAISSFTLRNVPRRMRFWVSSPNQRSTMLSHELLVGDALPAALARQTFPDDLAIQQAERGKQRGRSVPLVIVRLPRRDSRTERQQGGRPVQRLNLAFLVHGQDQGLVGRIQIEAHDVTEFLHEIRIPGQLEGLDPVGLQPMLLPDPLHGHPATAPEPGPSCGPSSASRPAASCAGWPPPPA